MQGNVRRSRARKQNHASPPYRANATTPAIPAAMLRPPKAFRAWAPPVFVPLLLGIPVELVGLVEEGPLGPLLEGEEVGRLAGPVMGKGELDAGRS